MAISENLKNKVSNKDIVGIRDNLFGLLAFDLGLNEGGKFDEALKYCLSNGIDESELFEDDDGKELSTEVTKENKIEICSMMGENFSKEKLEAAKRMGRILYPEEEKTQNHTGATYGSNSYNRSQNRQSYANNGNFWTELSTGAKVGIGIAVVACAAILVAVCSK